MKSVVVVGNEAKEGVRRAAKWMEPWLAERVAVQVDLGLSGDLTGDVVDFAVVLGGDGAVLQAARRLAPEGVPLLGINVGKFGFLTETSVDECKAVLDDVLAGRFNLAERMMLSCLLERDGEAALSTVGLNDAVVSRTALSRIITIDLHVNQQLVTTYRADGLIVATPVGSTAHSLASGGPIVCPEVDALVVTPICPHTLSNRPLVLPGDCEVTLEARQWAQNPALTVDGQVSAELDEGDFIRVGRAPRPLKLIRTGRNVFFETLRNKLDWRGQPRYVK
ncbi:MAG: NAD(+)/NADH kinase [Planctomycetota bacterium]|jgi:NAD+ kinase